jgi:hypothetical protein
MNVSHGVNGYMPPLGGLDSLAMADSQPEYSREMIDFSLISMPPTLIHIRKPWKIKKIWPLTLLKILPQKMMPT